MNDRPPGSAPKDDWIDYAVELEQQVKELKNELREAHSNIDFLMLGDEIIPLGYSPQYFAALVAAHKVAHYFDDIPVGKPYPGPRSDG